MAAEHRLSQERKLHLGSKVAIAALADEASGQDLPLEVSEAFGQYMTPVESDVRAALTAPTCIAQGLVAHSSAPNWVHSRRPVRRRVREGSHQAEEMPWYAHWTGGGPCAPTPRLQPPTVLCQANPAFASIVDRQDAAVICSGVSVSQESRLPDQGWDGCARFATAETSLDGRGPPSYRRTRVGRTAARPNRWKCRRLPA